MGIIKIEDLIPSDINSIITTARFSKTRFTTLQALMELEDLILSDLSVFACTVLTTKPGRCHIIITYTSKTTIRFSFTMPRINKFTSFGNYMSAIMDINCHVIEPSLFKLKCIPKLK